MCGKFLSYLDENIIKIGDIIKSDSFEKSLKAGNFLLAKCITKNKEYVINENLKPWKYNIGRINPKDIYCYTVYGFIKNIIKDSFQCVYIIKSPTFSIVSSHKNPYILEVTGILKIPYPVTNKYNNNSTITVNPFLLRHFPFLKREIEELYNDVEKSLPYSLLELSKEGNNNNKIVRITFKFPDYTKIVRNIHQFNNCHGFFFSICDAEPDTQYRYYLDNEYVAIRVLNHIKVSSTRVELSPVGGTFSSFLDYFSIGMYYLDRYGNKCKTDIPCPYYQCKMPRK